MGNKLGSLYAITDKKLIARENFAEAVRKAIRGGATIIQLREKETPENEIISLGKELLSVTKSYGVPLIINDGPEIAKEIQADGVHLGEGDCSIEHAREILGTAAIIGVSCYGSIERGLDAERRGANYAAFGTPYTTPTKPGRVPTPLNVLTQAKMQIKSIPIFAIGGIFPENARVILDTGVDGIAAITSIFGTDDPEQAARKLSSIL